jgi:hypothetical protein
MDIRQFTGRGIPIVKELAKQFGVTDDKVMQLVSDGKVGFAQIEKAFKSMTSEGGQFFNLMDAQSKTLLGQTSNLADAWDQLKTEIGKSQEGILKNTVSWASSMVSAMTDVVKLINFKSEAGRGLGSLNYGFKESFRSGDDRDSRYIVKYKDGSTKEFKNKEDYEASYSGSMFKTLNENKNVFSAYQGGAADRYDLFAEKILNKVSSVKPEDAQNALNELTVLKRDLVSQNENGEMSPRLLTNELSVLAKAMTTLKEMVRSSNVELENKKKGAGPGKDLETLAKANRPTQTIVNIENLVRELNNVYQNTTRGVELSAEQVGRILTGAVNDFSVLPGG